MLMTTGTEIHGYTDGGVLKLKGPVTTCSRHWQPFTRHSTGGKVLAAALLYVFHLIRLVYHRLITSAWLSRAPVCQDETSQCTTQLGYLYELYPVTTSSTVKCMFDRSACPDPHVMTGSLSKRSPRRPSAYTCMCMSHGPVYVSRLD
jgi:hypothetical protein